MPQSSADISRNQFRFGIVIAVVLHLFILGLFVFDVIPQQFHREGHPFWFHQGGDNIFYYNQAQSILSGEFEQNKYPLGFPILLTPLILIFQPPGHDILVQPVAIFWGVFMFPIGQLLLARVALMLTGKRLIALISVFLWTALPLLVYAGVSLFWNAEVAEVSAVHLTWAQMLSDGPATLFTLLLFFVFCLGREKDYPNQWMILLGFIAGFLVLIRLTGVLGVAVVALLLVIERRWQALGIMGFVAFITFSPQLLYNNALFGSPFTTGYTVLDELPADGLFSLRYLLEAMQSIGENAGVVLILLILVTIIALFAGLRILWQWNRFAGILIGLWIASYLVVYGIYYYSWLGGLMRFWMPMFPAIAIVIAMIIWGGYSQIGSKNKRIQG